MEGVPFFLFSCSTLIAIEYAMGTSYGQLGLNERIEIYRLHADAHSLRFIAKTLGRDVSTISRELKRNSKNSHRWRGG